MSEKSADQPGLPLLEIRKLKMYFPVKGGVFMTAKAQCKAVDGVSLVIRAGETLGLVGESGCGKSTLGKCIVRLNQPTSGEILFDGADLAKLSRSEMKPHRRNIQMIFQDPADSLNSRHTVGNILEEPFIVHGIGNEAERRARVSELLRTVGLPAGAAERFPFEFSGGFPVLDLAAGAAFCLPLAVALGSAVFFRLPQSLPLFPLSAARKSSACCFGECFGGVASSIKAGTSRLRGVAD